MNRLHKYSCGEFGRSRGGAQRRGEKCCRGEDEDDGCRHRGAGLVAARHGALHRVRLILGSATVVFTAYRRFGGGRLNGRSLLSPLVAMRSERAETSDAATHPICFEGHSPQRSPQENDRQQAHPSGHLPSGSDRAVERLDHELSPRITHLTVAFPCGIFSATGISAVVLAVGKSSGGPACFGFLT